MKTAKKPRPKSLKPFLITSKNVSKKGLSKPVLTLLCLPLTDGDTTLAIYRVRLQIVKKKSKRNKKLKALVGKIGWIFFEALVVFWINYLLLKSLS